MTKPKYNSWHILNPKCLTDLDDPDPYIYSKPRNTLCNLTIYAYPAESPLGFSYTREPDDPVLADIFHPNLLHLMFHYKKVDPDFELCPDCIAHPDFGLYALKSYSENINE